MQTILSYGMGVESTAILVRWLLEPETCPCPHEELLVISAQTGDEYQDTKRDVEAHILPLMREHSVRFVQVARHGHLEGDGVTLLDDSRSPTTLFIEGDYKLSDELRINGTVPQFGGAHKCSQKFKAFVIETWLASSYRPCISGARATPVRHAFGYNSDETKRVEKCIAADAKRVAFGFNLDEPKRIAKATLYDTPLRESFFPLVEWGWTRQDCMNYLMEAIGISVEKSACVYCPFNALKDDSVRRHQEHPEQVADAMLLEHLSLSMNPRGTLYSGKSLIQITLDREDEKATVAYRQRLKDSDWALYRVRRIYHAKKTDAGINPAKKGMADRAVELLLRFPSQEQANEHLSALAADFSTEVEFQRNIPYLYRERKGEVYPAREEFYTVAPAYVQTKARYGINRFDEQWDSPQGSLLFVRTAADEICFQP